MREKQVYVGMNSNEIHLLTLKIFPGKESNYEFYQDDGQSLNYQQGQYLITEISVRNDPGLEIVLKKKEGEYIPDIANYLLNIYRAEPVNSVTVNGVPVKLSKSSGLQNAETGYQFDPDKKMLVIKYVSESQPGSDRVKHKYNPKIEIMVE